MFAAIDSFIARHVKLNPEEITLFHSCLKPARLGRKEHFLQEGMPSRYEAFIVKGCLRKYCVDDLGHEVNLQFGIEDWWMGDLVSMAEQKPAQVNIQALEVSELLLINITDKEKLLAEIPKLERMFRIMVQRSMNALQSRFVAILTQPAEQRYAEFAARYPQFLQRIPQHYIAGYLGMTPEFLSKVRKRISVRH